MERALKAELAKLRPDLHPGFSRPGLLTFKATGRQFGPEEAPTAIFARIWAASAGPCLTADAVAATARDVGATRLFVSSRELFRPDRTPPAAEAAAALEVERWRRDLAPAFAVGPPALGDTVLDVLTAPGEPPVVGWHVHAQWRHEGPGGAFDVETPDAVPSRDWRKVVEGLRWSGARLTRGDLVLELGAAPGGGTRALVEAGCRVLTVDAQPMDLAVLRMPGVTHYSRRIGDLKGGALPKDIRWVASSAGIPPEDLLHAIERLRPALPALRGFLLTLKLHDDGVIRHLPATLNHLRKLGANVVRARQLPANRRDIFVYAEVGAAAGGERQSGGPRAPRPERAPGTRGPA